MAERSVTMAERYAIMAERGQGVRRRTAHPWRRDADKTKFGQNRQNPLDAPRRNSAHPLNPGVRRCECLALFVGRDLGQRVINCEILPANRRRTAGS